MGGPSAFIKSLEIIDHKRAKERTMKIKLNVDWTGAVDGIHIQAFAAGSEQDFPERIAAVLLQDGRAILPAGPKALPGAPENKMIPGPAEDKGPVQTGPVRKPRASKPAKAARG